MVATGHRVVIYCFDENELFVSVIVFTPDRNQAWSVPISGTITVASESFGVDKTLELEDGFRNCFSCWWMVTDKSAN